MSIQVSVKSVRCGCSLELRASFLYLELTMTQLIFVSLSLLACCSRYPGTLTRRKFRNLCWTMVLKYCSWKITRARL